MIVAVRIRRVTSRDRQARRGWSRAPDAAVMRVTRAIAPYGETSDRGLDAWTGARGRSTRPPHTQRAAARLCMRGRERMTATIGARGCAN
jgi:hypothetical protein